MRCQIVLFHDYIRLLFGSTGESLLLSRGQAKMAMSAYNAFAHESICMVLTRSV